MRLRRLLFGLSLIPLVIAILGFGFLAGVQRLECYQHSDDGYCLSIYQAPFYRTETRFRLSQIQAVELKEYVSLATPGQRTQTTISYGVVLRTSEGEFALTSYSSTNKAEMQAQIDSFERFLNDPQHPPLVYESSMGILGYGLAIGFGLGAVLLIVLGIYLPGPNNNR
jgi:hypothetical protein